MDIKTDDAIWLGGYLTGSGSFALGVNGPRLNLRATKRGAGVIRASQLMVGREALLDKQGRPHCSVSGERLHEVMKAVWPYLTDDRKREYARMRKRASSR